jgi:hypothetical protein
MKPVPAATLAFFLISAVTYSIIDLNNRQEQTRDDADYCLDITRDLMKAAAYSQAVDYTNQWHNAFEFCVQTLSKTRRTP